MAAKKDIGVSKRNGSIQEGGMVIQQINIRPVARPEYADVGRWRTAHKSAEAYSGIRAPLYDLYSDALLDGFLKQQVKKRILNVTKNKLKYLVKDQEVEEANVLMRKKEFRKLRKAIQNAKAWGIAVIELMNENGELKIFDVPKKHIRPDQGIITLEQFGSDGLDYRKLKTVVEVGDWDDLGYLLEATPCAFIKRGDIGDWANYAQMFGMPFREARYDGYNEQVRIQLEKSMERAASAAYAVLPREAEIKFHETSNSAGSNTLYDSLRKAMNEEMSVLILGSTETTTSSKSSGYAQSETHRKTTNDIAQDDKADELSVLNDDVLDILVLLGLLPPGGEFVYDEPIDLETAAKKVSVGQQMKTAGVPVDDDYFYEVSGVPKPKDYKKQKAQKEEQKDETPDKKLAAEQKEDLKGFFRFSGLAGCHTELQKTLLADYSCQHGCDHAIKLEAGDDELEELALELAKMYRDIWNKKQLPKKINKPVSKFFASQLWKAATEGFGSDEIDYDTPDGKMLAHIRENVYQFAGAKNYQQMKAITEKLIGDDGKLREFRAFKEEAMSITTEHMQWLRTEYNTAVAGGQMASKWMDIQKNKELLPYLEFDAVIDKRTTELCASLNGVIKTVDDPFWKKYYPPNHFNCRSSVRQLRQGTVTKDEDITYPDLPKMFETNLATDGLVFPKKSAYFKDIPESILKQSVALIPKK